jgi:hypothetical protein
MNYGHLHAGILHQDSILIQLQVDSSAIPATGNKSQFPDSVEMEGHQSHSKTADSIHSIAFKNFLVQKQELKEIREQTVTVYNPYKRAFNSSDNFLLNNSLRFLKKNQKTFDTKDSSYAQVASKLILPSVKFQLQDRYYVTSNWPFFVFIFIILLYIWIKVFYNKFFSFIANSLISYQLSAKLFQERNFLLRRVSFVLDIIYHIVLSIFLFEIFAYRNLYPLKLTSYNLFFLFLNILILFTLARSVVLGIFNSLFNTTPLITEYIHNNFIVNKSIGIVLFPVVIAIYYLPVKIAGLLYVAGIMIIGIGILFKIVRGYQLIIRKDVLFSYLILYLCTLEILPLFLGYKVFMSLL